MGSFVHRAQERSERMRAKAAGDQDRVAQIMHDPIAKNRCLGETDAERASERTSQSSGNHPACGGFFNKVKRLWLASLKRRSQTAKASAGRGSSRFVARFFPPNRTLHPLPCHRFDARTRGRTRCVAAHAGSVAGEEKSSSPTRPSEAKPSGDYTRSAALFFRV